MSNDDAALRLSAFERIRDLARVFGDDIPWRAVMQGFECQGERVLLANRAVGIFKPRQMKRGAISIKTTQPRAGRINVYADAEEADGAFVYSLQGDDPHNHYNRALRECMEDQSPLIYFHAVAVGVYKAIFPCYIVAIDSAAMLSRVSVGVDAADTAAFAYALPEERLNVRRYALRETRVRLHQAEFREQVLAAYGSRCAMTSLPVPELLEAAHIVPDSHERGEASVNNGICLSRIHHRAFDANLIGIDADYRIQISDRLLAIQDGPLLEDGLKAFHGKSLLLPDNPRNWPDRDLLALRFDQFSEWRWA